MDSSADQTVEEMMRSMIAVLWKSDDNLKSRSWERTGAAFDIVFPVGIRYNDEEGSDGMENLICENCGANALVRKNEYLVCPYCDSRFAITREERRSGLFGGVRDKLMASLTQIRRNALRELKEAAYDLGCNAVIGVDFDYITLDPQTANLSGGTTYQPYVFCVTANGNAVIIEKIEE